MLAAEEHCRMKPASCSFKQLIDHLGVSPILFLFFLLGPFCQLWVLLTSLNIVSFFFFFFDDPKYKIKI